ncbi:DUF4333 domain-containing protein [Amycolatopsis rhabdoformis]|uniref:DUF4333 domain-containing protein n=1 Tax=Amycolatopsis rhabdoformis TaxID=1448059 RepID=A0ABZ1I9R7_9PSEU|nr:DUF4333 domain-containing protein [Amycolatopsis rhabdoformis]WSE30353.1 DUF4333 domain-containing protein [Amycolatopsis rhabdoformis]
MLRRVVVAVCGIALLAGCSAHVEVTRRVAKADLERGISDALEKSVGRRPDTITCPGAIDAKVGQQMRCQLVDGTIKAGLTATIDTVNGSNVHYSVKVDDQVTTN